MSPVQSEVSLDTARLVRLSLGYIMVGEAEGPPYCTRSTVAENGIHAALPPGPAIHWPPFDL